MKQKQTFKKLMVPVLVAAVLAGSVSMAAHAEKNQPETTDYVTTVTHVKGWTGSDVQKKASHTGREIVSNLSEAHQALEEQDNSLALKKLNEANKLNASVREIMPFANIREDIYNARGKLVFSDVDTYFDDLLPIYTQLDELQVYAPEVANNIRNHVKKSEYIARRGDAKAAVKPLDEVLDQISSTTVYMPVMFVDGQIKAAIGALNKDKPDSKIANTAVENALQSLRAYTGGVITEQPS